MDLHRTTPYSGSHSPGELSTLAARRVSRQIRLNSPNRFTRKTRPSCLSRTLRRRRQRHRRHTTNTDTSINVSGDNNDAIATSASDTLQVNAPHHTTDTDERRACVSCGMHSVTSRPRDPLSPLDRSMHARMCEQDLMHVAAHVLTD
jgi:hypothetical protein